MSKPDESNVVTDTAAADAAAALAATEAATEAAATAATEAAAKEVADAEAATAKDAELPEWARAELTRVRDEAAKSRIALRETTTKFEGAKTPEEFAAAVAEMTAENTRLAHDLVRNTVGTKHQLPPELIDVLKGDTPEELEAHAKLLSKFATGIPPENLSGGLNPGDTDGAFDPVAEAMKARRRY